MPRLAGVLLRTLALGSCLAALPVFAQSTAATLVGDVVDASGGVVAGATVIARNTGTGVAREVQTNELGQYRVFPLNPGSYEVTVTKAGFRTRTVPNVTLEVASNVKVDFSMDVGAVTESVQVTAAAPMLQTQDATIGGVVTTQELLRIPVNGRNYTRLILLMPGSSDQGGSQSKGTGALSGTQVISVNGQRRQDNNFTVDGVDNNMMMMNSPGGSPPMDSIQEFKIANNTSAEFGRSAGSNINVVTKSGTRSLHGSVYEYFRNDKLDANDFFANREGRGKVPFRQNQYGVSLGGPVVLPKLYNGRENTFFFGNWEGFRRRRGATALGTAPIAAQRAGDFSQQPRTIYDPLTSRLNANGTIQRDPFPGNRIPQERISPAIRYFLDTIMPLPNRPGLTNNLLNSESQRNDRDLWVFRVDHNFNQANNVFFRYSSQNAGQVAPQANVNLYSDARFDVRNWGAGWNRIFSPTTVLEVKFGFNNPNNPGATLNRVTSREDFLANAGIRMYQPDVLFSPIPNFNAVGEFSAGGGGDIARDKIYQTVGSLSLVRGAHSIKFGINYSYRDFFTNTSNPMNGDANFDRRLTSISSDPNSGHSFATMLLGFPTEIRRGQGNTLTQGRQHAPHLFVQDDWRVTSRLTLNLGVRYEYQNPMYDTTDRLGNLWIRRNPATGEYTGTLLWAGVNPEVDPDTGKANQPPKQDRFGRALMQSDRNNFAPRIGLAWQASQRTVVRAGVGVFYNSTFVQELQDLRKFWPYTVQQVFVANSETVVPDLPITGAGPSFSNTAAIGGWPQNPENRTPYSQQWNVAVQQQLLDDLSLEVAYVGSENRKQVGYTAINAATPGPGPIQPRRLLPSFGDLDGGSNRFLSNYNALQAKLTKRFSRGLMFNANYTWGRAMDEQSSLAEWKAQDPYNIRADYSRASIDIRHIFNFSYVYDLPFGRGRQFGAGWNRLVDGLLGGWAIDGFVRAQTGAPLNVVSGQDWANVGRTYQRPDVLRDPNNGPKTPDEWFDIRAFRLPLVPFTYGNAGAFIVEQDGRHSYDVSLAKKFYPFESQHIEFRGEFFNISNTVKMGAPGGNLAGSTFGRVTSATDARQVQLVLRYQF